MQQLMSFLFKLIKSSIFALATLHYFDSNWLRLISAISVDACLTLRDKDTKILATEPSVTKPLNEFENSEEKQFEMRKDSSRSSKMDGAATPPKPTPFEKAVRNKLETVDESLNNLEGSLEALLNCKIRQEKSIKHLINIQFLYDKPQKGRVEENEGEKTAKPVLGDHEQNLLEYHCPIQSNDHGKNELVDAEVKDSEPEVGADNDHVVQEHLSQHLSTKDPEEQTHIDHVEQIISNEEKQEGIDAGKHISTGEALQDPDRTLVGHFQDKPQGLDKKQLLYQGEKENSNKSPEEQLHQERIGKNYQHSLKQSHPILQDQTNIHQQKQHYSYNQTVGRGPYQGQIPYSHQQIPYPYPRIPYSHQQRIPCPYQQIPYPHQQQIPYPPHQQQIPYSNQQQIPYSQEESNLQEGQIRYPQEEPYLNQGQIPYSYEQQIFYQYQKESPCEIPEEEFLYQDEYPLYDQHAYEPYQYERHNPYENEQAQS